MARPPPPQRNDYNRVVVRLCNCHRDRRNSPPQRLRRRPPPPSPPCQRPSWPLMCPRRCGCAVYRRHARRSKRKKTATTSSPFLHLPPHHRLPSQRRRWHCQMRRSYDIRCCRRCRRPRRNGWHHRHRHRTTRATMTTRCAERKRPRDVVRRNPAVAEIFISV